MIKPPKMEMNASSASQQQQALILYRRFLDQSCNLQRLVNICISLYLDLFNIFIIKNFVFVYFYK